MKVSMMANWAKVATPEESVVARLMMEPVSLASKKRKLASDWSLR